jgi:O-antigen ligase
MRIDFLEKFTKISFLALATLPFLKANYNSKVIILWAVVVLVSFFKINRKHKFNINDMVYTLPFFMFFFYEIFSGSFNLSRIILVLPFLIFPTIFLLKPKFINEYIFNLSFLIFQISVLLQSFIYLFVFLKENSIFKLLDISSHNIPFFREYVTNNYLIELHPTYFSSFLLFSITISLFKFIKKRFFHFFNIISSLFFIVLFSSRIIILLLLLTFVCYIIFIAYKNRKKESLIIGVIVLTVFLFIANTKVVKDRFYEIKEQMNNPIVGSYYNSSNTRLAIYKCDYLLIKEVPFFGFGNNLQIKLNQCYADNNNSEFYQISVFNTHNYYFNLILYGGWFFLFLFLIYLFFIFERIKKNPLHLFVFIQFLLINLTENYLSRHYGIVLFCYFVVIFVTINKDE